MKRELTEKELALRCAQKEAYAQQILYQRYSGQLMAICLRYLGDCDTAQDVFHDGIIRIFQSFDKFAYMGDGSLRAWLSRVMVNEALGYLRKRSAQLQQEVVVDEIPDNADEDSYNDDEEQIPNSVLMKLIGELPDGYRTVFNLYVFEEKSHKEIGALLGITEHTSSSQYYRARNLLIRKINEYKKNQLK